MKSAIDLFAEHESDPNYLNMAAWVIRTSEDDGPIGAVLNVVKQHHMSHDSLDAFLRRAYGLNNPSVNAFMTELAASGDSPASMVARLLAAANLSPDSDRERLVQLLQGVVNFEGDVRYGDTDYKNLADGQLFSLLRLQIGAEAPDIEGLDVDGVHFKLSEYRGKVVMLDFWGDW